jgi:hypothetical protein
MSTHGRWSLTFDICLSSLPQKPNKCCINPKSQWTTVLLNQG